MSPGSPVRTAGRATRSSSSSTGAAVTVIPTARDGEATDSELRAKREWLNNADARCNRGRREPGWYRERDGPASRRRLGADRPERDEPDLPVTGYRGRYRR